MHRSGGLPDGLAGSPLFPSWPDYITNMSGYDFRKGQDLEKTGKEQMRHMEGGKASKTAQRRPTKRGTK
jgi:hypothetical protein